MNATPDQPREELFLAEALRNVKIMAKSLVARLTYQLTGSPVDMVIGKTN